MSTETKTARTWCDHWKYDGPGHAVPGARGVWRVIAKRALQQATRLTTRGFRIAKVAEDHEIHPYNEKEE